MDRRAYAVYAALIGLLIGLIGNVLFYRHDVGISFPIFIGLALALIVGFALSIRLRPSLRNLWLVIPILFFAAMIAVRADPLISVLNGLTVVSLGALLLYYLPSEYTIDTDAFVNYVGGAVSAGFQVLVLPFGVAIESLGWVRDRRPLRNQKISAVGRGLLFAVPILVVFALLLGSADAVFGDYLNRLGSLFQIQNAEDLFNQGFLTFLFGWLGCGALAVGVLRQPESHERYVQVGDKAPVAVRAKQAPAPTGVGATHESPTQLDALEEDAELAAIKDVRSLDELFELEAAPSPPTPLPQRETGANTNGTRVGAIPKGKSHPFMLGMIESGIILGGVVLLFGAFVAVQFAYFFGGQENVSIETGLTYAQYARRGFFELVAVSVLTLGLVLWLDWVTVRHNPTQNWLFRGLSVALVALTGVMLLSASGRMALYEEAYGYTHLRVYVHEFIRWLAVLFVVFLLALFRLRERIFSFGTLLVILGYLVTLNLMNVDDAIARQNIARYENGHELDVAYLRTFSYDSIPAMIDLYLTTRDKPDSEDINVEVGQWLVRQQRTLDAQIADWSVFEAHAARDGAWAALDAVRDQLPEYDPDYYFPYSSYYDYEMYREF